MSVDIKALEAEIDDINDVLSRTYFIPSRIYNKVKDVILDQAETKVDDPELVFTYQDVQELGKKLIHNTIYDFTTRLRRETFNDVVHRLMRRGVLESCYFTVRTQQHRKLYARLGGIDYKELMLLAAIDNELRSFSLDKHERAVKIEDELVSRVIASAAVHGAMIAKGFHKDLLNLKFGDVDLNKGFVSLKQKKAAENDDADAKESAFFRHVMSPVTMVYLLRLMLFYKKDKKTLQTPIIDVESWMAKAIFDQRWIRDSGKTLETVFKAWTGRIAADNGLDIELGVERFRKVCIVYLATKYPIFLLSVHMREPISDSLDMRSFAPLLNIEFFDSKKVTSPRIYADDNRRDYRKLFAKDEDFVETIERISLIRGKLKKKEANKSRKIRKALARMINSRIRKLEGKRLKENKGMTAVLDNYKLYWKWVISLIENIDIKGGSIDTYTGSVGRFFIPLLVEKPIRDMTIEEIDDKIQKFLRGYETSEPESNLKKFIAFVMDECKREDLKKLYHKRYPNMGVSHPKPLIYFDDVDTVLTGTTDRALRCAIILGFYGGLRAGEVERLTLDSLIYDGGYVLCVRKSKTRNGIRNVPLHLLMPEQYLREIVDYWMEARTKGTEGSPFKLNEGRILNSKKLARKVMRLFKRRLNMVIRFHHLRHSFVNWFLIRWFAALNGKDHFVQEAPFLKNVLFSEPYLEKVRILLFGYRELQRGQSSFSHVFAALARLVGHGSPNVTITNYIHTVDFLAYLSFRRKYADYRVKLTSKGLAELLNVSYETLPDHFRGKGYKDIRIQDIVEAQKNRLGLSVMGL